MEKKSGKRNAVREAVILAGGKGKRMGGVEKALLDLQGRPFLDYLLETLSCFFSKISISTNSPKLYNRYGLSIIEDEFPDKGPMAGILAALENIDSDFLFFVPCDTPLLQKGLIQCILERIDKLKNGLVIEDQNRRLHPLLGVYGKSLAPLIRKRILDHRLKLQELVAEANLQILPFEAWKTADPQGISLLNINNRSDYEKLKNMDIPSDPDAWSP